MDIFQILTILTCVTSTVTMILVSVAVLPHVKQGMVLIRDAILWVTFVLVVAAAGWLGGQRLSERFFAPSRRPVDHSGSTQTRAATVSRAPFVAPDPYYHPPSSD